MQQVDKPVLDHCHLLDTFGVLTHDTRNSDTHKKYAIIHLYKTFAIILIDIYVILFAENLINGANEVRFEKRGVNFVAKSSENNIPVQAVCLKNLGTYESLFASLGESTFLKT